MASYLWDTTLATVLRRRPDFLLLPLPSWMKKGTRFLGRPSRERASLTSDFCLRVSTMCGIGRLRAQFGAENSNRIPKHTQDFAFSLLPMNQVGKSVVFGHFAPSRGQSRYTKFIGAKPTCSGRPVLCVITNNLDSRQGAKGKVREVEARWWKPVGCGCAVRAPRS